MNFQTLNVDFEIVSKLEIFNDFVTENSIVEAAENILFFGIKSKSPSGDFAVYYARDFLNLESTFFSEMFEMSFVILSFPTPLKSQSGVWISEVVSRIKTENPTINVTDLRAEFWPLINLSNEFKEQVILISKIRFKTTKENSFMNFVLPSQSFSTFYSETKAEKYFQGKDFLQSFLNLVLPPNLSKVLISIYLKNHRLLSKIWLRIPYRIRSGIIRRLVDRNV
jgi:hypothetical protein